VTIVDLCGSAFRRESGLSRAELEHHRVGVLPEILIGNGQQIAGQFTKPASVEVPFGPPRASFVWSRCSSDEGKRTAFHRK